MQSGSTVLRVSPGPGGDWLVREPGQERALRRAKTREAALRDARQMMEFARGGTVEVYDEAPDATHREASSVIVVAPVGRKRPWWMITRRPRSAFLIGGLWAVVFLVRAWLSEEEHWYDLLLLVGSGLLAAWYLVCGFVQVRYRRRRLPS